MTTAPLIPRLDRERLDWEAAARAAIATAAPLLTLYIVDRLDLAMYASFAAFTALYGRREPYRKRIVTLVIAGVAMFGAMALGVLVQLSGLSWWLLALGFAAVVAAGVVLTDILKWIPKGAIFFVFSFLGCCMKPIDPAIVGEALAVAAVVVVWCWMLGMSGWMLRRVPWVAERLRPLKLDPKRRLVDALNPQSFWLIGATVVLGLAALAIASVLGVATHHYWAAVTVVAIFSAPTALIRYNRISHRVGGTLLGVGIAAALYGGDPHPLYVIAVIVVCNLVTELIVGQHYGFALAFITPIAIGATSLGSVANWEVLFVDRARETLLGGAICFAVVLGMRWAWRRAGRELPAS